MVGQFKKAYLHRPIKVLQVSHTHENWKMLHITSKYFSFFSNEPPANWVVHVTRDFLTCYSCSYYSSMMSLKFRVCYITGQWGKFAVKNVPLHLHILSWLFVVVVVVVHQKICVFVNSMSFFEEVSNFRSRILTNQKPE